MGIFGFLKRKKQELELEEETISFNQIGNWIEKRQEKIKQEQRPALKQIKETLSDLLDGLDEKMVVLRNLNLDEKKAPERAMSIVRENFDKFIYELEKLILNLKGLLEDDKKYEDEEDGGEDEEEDENEEEDSENKGLESLIKRINSIFGDFEKKSITSYQKSTFLIGDELGAVTRDIAKFFKGFNKIIKENDFSIKQGKTILIIEEKLTKIDNLEESKQETRELIQKIDEKIEGFEDKIKELNNQISEMKMGEEYTNYTESKNKLESNKTKLTIELQALKDLIDFKALAKIYHSIQNKMKLVKEYKEDFKDSLKKHGDEKFMDLVDIKGIDKKRVKERIESINSIKENIKETEKELGRDESLELGRDVKIVYEKISELNLEKIKVDRRNKTLISNVDRIRKEVVEVLGEVRVVVKEEKSSDE